MRKNGILFLSIVILAAVLIAGVPFFVYAQDSSTLQEEKAELESEIDRINKQIEQYENELGDRREEIQSLQQQVNTINARINKINAEINRTQAEINVTQITIGETQNDIHKTTLTIQERKQVLGELLRSISKIDDETLLEKIVRYEKLSDVLQDVQRLDTLQLEMIRTLDAARAARIELEQKKEVLKENEEVLNRKKAQLAVQRNAEASEKENRNVILTETKQEEAKFQQLLSQAQQERAEYMERILQIEEQIAISRNFQSYFKAGEVPPPGTKLFIWPQKDAVLTQGYGFTNFAQRGAYGGTGHNGIDLSAGLASEILAAAGGKVIAKGNRACVDYVDRSCNGFWGNWVAIEHPGGLVTLYSHMTQPSNRAPGETVEVGDVIGFEGATGNITGPHLHFTVYTEFFTFKDPATGETRFSYNFDKTLNPLDYL